MKIKLIGFLFPLIFVVMGLCSCAQKEDNNVVRIGFFPNISHAQALVAQQTGWFEKRLGKDIKVQWQAFNAGPDAMLALMSNSVALTYVGPNPVLNSFAKGAKVVVLSGAAEGGAGLVVNPKLNIKTPSDFKGKKIGTPQLANTQDVACRAWLIKNGVKVSQSGGEASVIPVPNPSQLQAFVQGDLDAVWTVEPWITRLEKEGGAKMFLQQNDTVTTVLASTNKNFKNRADIIKKILDAHIELTAWINANPEQAQRHVKEALERFTGGKISAELIKTSWRRLNFTSKINKADMQEFINSAYSCGFIRNKVDISKIFVEAEK